MNEQELEKGKKRIIRIVTHDEYPDRAAELWAEKDEEGKGIMAIGYADWEDITGKTRDELKQIARDWGEGHSEQEIGSWVGTLIRFRDKIQKEDLVLAYNWKTKKVALVGEVTGEYYYDNGNGNEIGRPKKSGGLNYPQQRKVRWWDTPRDFPRSFLPGELAEKVSLRGTLHVLFEYENQEFEKIKEQIRKISQLPSEMEEVGERSLTIESENQIKDYLEGKIDELEEGLTMVEREKEVSVGVMDFLAEDKNKNPVVIEVKKVADDATIGQILGYMRAYEEENTKNVRGIIVAEEFAERCKKAVKGQNISLYKCKLKFEFIKI